MAQIQIKTKIDITNTDVRHADQGSEQQLNQYRNYTTFLQVIGIRSIFSITQRPVEKDGVWIMEIETDRDNVFVKDQDPIGLLKEDLDKVPIITGLTEKTPIKQGLIRTSGKEANTFVSLIR
jgi:hypothetical protein